MQLWFYGAGGHERVVGNIVQDLGWSVAGVFDDRALELSSTGSIILLGLTNPDFQRPAEPMIVTVGNPQARKRLAVQLGGPFATAIHSSAIVGQHVHVGEGTVVMQGAILQTHSQLGRHVIINTGATIDHDCQIEDFVHVAPQATLCGDVSVGEGSWIGAGAVVIQGIKIGKWAMVGAGAVVIRDVPDFATVVGNPARVIKKTILNFQDELDQMKDVTNSLPDTMNLNPAFSNNESPEPSSHADSEASAKFLAQLLSIINQVLLSSQRPALETIGPQQRLQADLGLDSLELAELTVRIEAETGVDVFREGVVRTVGEVLEKLGASGEK